MSYTQGTTHYNLPQTLGDDKRDWFDTNQAFADVDSALFTSYEGVQTLDKDLTKVKSDLLTAQSDITGIKSHNAQTDVKVSALETLTAQHTVDIEDVRNDAEDMVCAIEELTATAQYEHVTGNLFRYNDTLYVAIANINIGDQIVPNVNCRTTSVANQLRYEESAGSLGSNDYFSSLAIYFRRIGNIISFTIGLRTVTEVPQGVYQLTITGMPKPIQNMYYTVYSEYVIEYFNLDYNVDSTIKVHLSKDTAKNLDIWYTGIYATLE